MLKPQTWCNVSSAAEAPDRLWVADITYVPTGAGFLYLAVVVDVFSRRVVGWAMESHIRTELVLQALNMALYLRRPQGVIHHSDQGIQYTAYAFGKRCREWGVRPSMGSVGDCYDNALCESFFASLECELLDRRSFQTHAEARMAVFHYIEGWYNTHRRHSSIGYYAPIAFERKYTSNIQHVEPLTVHQIGSTPIFLVEEAFSRFLRFCFLFLFALPRLCVVRRFRRDVQRLQMLIER